MANERGSALLLTIIVTFVLVFLGGSLALYGAVEVRQAGREEAEIQAYYLARSGADALAQGIINHPKKLEDILGETTSYELGNGSFTARATEENGIIRITSKGTVGRSQSVVELTLLPDEVEPELPYAIFAATGSKGSGRPAIEVNGSGKIHGTVGTNSLERNSVKITGAGLIDGKLLVGPGAKPSDVVYLEGSGRVTEGYGNLTSVTHYPTPSFPDFPELPWRGNFSTPWKEGLDYRIVDDGWYDSIEVTSSRTLKIDLGGGVRVIRVKDIKIEGDIELINAGTDGRLILYVDNSFSTSGNRNINYKSGGPHDPKRLTIYYAGRDTFGNAQFNLCGDIVVKDAPIVIANGSSVRGSIYSGGSSVTVAGSASTLMGLIYAPEAHVWVSGSGVTNAIVASTLKVDGNAEVFQSDMFSPDFPDDIFSPGTSNVYYRGNWFKGKN